MARDRRTLGCEAAIEALQDALDERARPQDRSVWLSAHLAGCASCRARARGLERVDGAGRLLARALRRRPSGATGRAVQGWMAAAAATWLFAGSAVVAHVAAGAGGRDLGRGVDGVLVALERTRALFAGDGR